VSGQNRDNNGWNFLSMTTIKSLCVFCGSKFGASPAYEAAARKLGEIMVERGIRLVYGGGSIGLMGVVADTITEGGGEVIGVIPKFLEDLEVGKRDVSEFIVTDNMHSRKNKMFELSDGFVSLPGGLGTLDETFEIMTWKQLQIHAKPIVVMNVEGYWAGLKQLIEDTIQGGFAHEKARDLISIVETPDQVFDALDHAPQPDRIVLTSHL
jgi:uncharacterized protein (TIGR00730 family)